MLCVVFIYLNQYFTLRKMQRVIAHYLIIKINLNFDDFWNCIIFKPPLVAQLFRLK